MSAYRPAVSPWRVLIPVGLGTSLSLLGDTSLYTVLPTHVHEAGVAVAGVGILLSANRWIRLLANGPAGLAYERWPRRRLFVLALFAGALSTAFYALTVGFWPLLVGRLLWGLAWSGIWVGGNTIVLDISEAGNRGRWVGVYQTAFFLGAASGSLLGGVLTDLLGYHTAMGIASGLTLAGALLALLSLPETRHLRSGAPEPPAMSVLPPASGAAMVAASGPAPVPDATHVEAGSGRLAAAFALLGVNRLALPGILMPTLGLYVAERLGDPARLDGVTIGVATLTGVMLSLNALISMAAAPSAGALSDRIGSRWRAVALGLLPGIAGFAVFGFAPAAVALLGILLIAIASGSNASLSTTLIGDLSRQGKHGRRLGVLFTTGDLASAVGPPLAFAMIPLLGIRGLYLAAGGLFVAMFLVALQQAGGSARRARMARGS